MSVVKGTYDSTFILFYPQVDGTDILLTGEDAERWEKGIDIRKVENLFDAMKSCDRCGKDVAQFCAGCMEMVAEVAARKPKQEPTCGTCGGTEMLDKINEQGGPPCPSCGTRKEE